MVAGSERRAGSGSRARGGRTRRAGDALLVTCEHGGNRVPASCAGLFRGARRLLDSHRGWDPGALQLARQMARRLRAPLVAATISRLVVDLNRSPGHPRLLSERTRALDAAARRALLARHYHPHRARVLDELGRLLARRRRVVHIAVHSFTPVLDGVRRRADVGLLYDPRRREEAAFARRWSRALRAADPTLCVLANRPYRGDADGLTTSLRRLHPEERYLGIELEVNQDLLAAGPRRWREVRALLVDTLREALRG